MAKKNPTRFTIFMRDMREHSVAKQRGMCQREARRRRAEIVAEYIAHEHDGGERDEWIKRTRADEGAMVAGMYVIPERATKGKRPGADYAAALQRLVRKVALVVDAETGATSDDGGKWDAAIVSGAHKTASGRRLTKPRAVAMRAKQVAEAKPGVVEHWLSPQMKPARDRWAQHWRDIAYRSAREALDAMPEEIRAELGSLETARRIFGRRRPGDPSAGGRPPKKTKRKTKRT